MSQVLQNCTFIGNQADKGGVLFIDSYSNSHVSVIVNQSTFSEIKGTYGKYLYLVANNYAVFNKSQLDFCGSNGNKCQDNGPYACSDLDYVSYSNTSVIEFYPGLDLFFEIQMVDYFDM
eukprot:TRINITY_DN868_c0_g1_i12.p1 TRINITY_DN868_c0_g1~~TRINITY_DN868_c0_g1_i12.p1  ORF type:complete len:119 (-),score=25.97 TRINITY_DN868_c0_g1_i12:565-921(-)